MGPLSVRIQLAYDGTRYLGWQETKEGPSIQGILRAAAMQILQAPVEIEAASRTDAGVHAEGQVVVIRCSEARYPIDRFVRSLGRLLPSDLAIVEGAEVSGSFHPTLDATGKTYLYRIALQPMPLLRHQVWTLPSGSYGPVQLDVWAMRQAATSLLGRHDFSAFATDQIDYPVKNPVCELRRLDVEEPAAGLVQIRLEGDRFLYKMCRTLAGTLADVGRGRICGSSMPAILADKRRERAGVCAPAQGLTLQRVHYRAPFA
jgi:tRNA pseudouridine38-40 synthase